MGIHRITKCFDFTPELLQALDAVSERLGINRQASIKKAVLA